MKPNVILINCDDMGYGDVGCFGSKVNKTPYLDEMARLGRKFTSFYSASPVCSPSRAGMMTGCYPPRIGINTVLFPGEPWGLNPNEYTIPKMFSENGYKSMIIGKWHCGDQPEFLPSQYGFDEYYGIPYSNDMGRQHLKPGFEAFSSNPPLPLISGDEVLEEQPDQSALTERYTEKAVSFIRKNKDNPFFLYFAHMHVHLPLYAAKRFVDESENGDFGACMAETDWSCGVIFRELKKLGIYDNTLIIFTSDNGSRGDHGASNAPLKGRKAFTWEGGQRVPFIALWNNHIKAGTETDCISSNIDLLPTFAKLIGAKLPEDIVIDGTDISEALFSDCKPRNEFIYFSVSYQKDAPQYGAAGFSALEAVRRGDWKLFLYRRGEKVNELYNLKEDISEEHNVYGEHPEIVAELTELFKEYEEKLGNHTAGIVGKEIRRCGQVENPKTLTHYDPDSPYIVAMYDKDDIG